MLLIADARTRTKNVTDSGAVCRIVAKQKGKLRSLFFRGPDPVRILLDGESEMSQQNNESIYVSDHAVLDMAKTETKMKQQRIHSREFRPKAQLRAKLAIY